MENSTQLLRSLKLERIKREARNSFAYFTKHIFSKSFDNFVYGDFVKETCDWYQFNNRTIRISARNHFKTAAMQAYLMWQIFRLDEQDMECMYFSYKQDMATYHIGAVSNSENLKSLIDRNPWFDGIRDYSDKSKTMATYSWDGNTKFTITPYGLLTAKRGLHTQNGIVIVDDPLQDPDNKLSPTSIMKVNNIFFSQIMDIPNTNKSPFHVVGTPQTNVDFFFTNEAKNEFDIRIQPAVKNPIYDEAGWLVSGEALWEQWRTFQDLQHRQRSRGQKIFSQEYMCTPQYDEDSFINAGQLRMCINPKLKNMKELDTQNEVIAGLDIGKKRHPSHFIVFELVNGVYIQRHSKWMDGWNYSDQVDYVNDMIDALGIDYVYYDATRGELESLFEQGELGGEWQPVVISRKVYGDLGRELDKAVSKQEIQLIDDDRTIGQILAMNNDFKAMDTTDKGGGHGESFVSTLLSFKYRTEGGVSLNFI